MNLGSIAKLSIIFYIIGIRVEEGIVDPNNVEEYNQSLALLKLHGKRGSLTKIFSYLGGSTNITA